MGASPPLRIDDNLYRAAKAAAAVMSRSAAQQVTHWARIGMEVEARADVSIEDISRVLLAKAGYDALTGDEQAIVRVIWDQRMQTLREGLGQDPQFPDGGRPYVELDDDGNVVRRDPGRTRRRPHDR